MKEEIEELRTRLVDVRSELDSHITLSLPSRIDLVLLKQSEDFAKLDKDAQTLLDTILDTQATLSKQIGESAARVDSVVLAAAQTTQDAIEGASARNEAAHARSRLQLDRLEQTAANARSETARSAIRALTAIEELQVQQQTEQEQTRETIETLTQQERSAQEQIARLEQEIKNLKEMIQKGVHLLMHGLQSEQQQRHLKNDTNLWYKLWAAKEVMLQKLKVRYNPGEDKCRIEC
jgi:chromosome segregation ATPase